MAERNEWGEAHEYALKAYYKHNNDPKAYNEAVEEYQHAWYDQTQMDPTQHYVGGGYNAQYGYPPGYAAQYAQQQTQQQQQYASPAPAIKNPFAPPTPPAAAASSYAAHNASFDPDEQQQIQQWQSQYAPVDQQPGRKGTKATDNANLAPLGQRGSGAVAAAGTEEAKKKGDDGKYTVIRKGGGEQWEDKSLLEWDPTKFRIMVGNLAGEVTDDSLAKAFANYGVSKARVIRDKRTTKSKGFGFVEFNEAEEGFKAAREMANKYIGSHPVIIKRSTTDVRPAVKKDNKNNKNRGKNNNSKDKQGKNKNDPLKANTGAGVEKKAAKPAPGLKLLG